MIEVSHIYEIRVDADMKAFPESARKIVAAMVKHPGLIEVRAWRGVLYPRTARAISVWRSMEDWGNFIESEAGRMVVAELAPYATNQRIEVWAPAPTMPDPIRPTR